MSHRPDAHTHVQAGTSSASGLLDLLGSGSFSILSSSLSHIFPCLPSVFPQELSWSSSRTFLGAPPLWGRTGPLQPCRLEAETYSAGPQAESAPKGQGSTLPQGLCTVILGLSDSPGRQWLHLTDPLNSCNREKAAPSIPWEPSSKRRENGWFSVGFKAAGSSRVPSQGRVLSYRRGEGEARALSQNLSSPTRPHVVLTQVTGLDGGRCWQEAGVRKGGQGDLLGNGGRRERDRNTCWGDSLPSRPS